MKRFLFAVSLSFLVILSQAGCGGGGGSTPSAGSSAVSTDGSSAAGTTQTGAGTTTTAGATSTGDTASTAGSTPAGSAVATGGSATGGTGVATLSWDATLAGAAGFKLYFGTSSKSYSSSVNVGTAPSYALSGLAPGTYYFAVTAYDAFGNESAYSNEVSKTIS